MYYKLDVIIKNSDVLRSLNLHLDVLIWRISNVIIDPSDGPIAVAFIGGRKACFDRTANSPIWRNGGGDFLRFVVGK